MAVQEETKEPAAPEEEKKGASSMEDKMRSRVKIDTTAKEETKAA